MGSGSADGNMGRSEMLGQNKKQNEKRGINGQGNERKRRTGREGS